ncbi:Uma2 family endonuclease [Tsukamurella sp. M9C]|uniref:Uma2 family endonuclease n=1 Tax=Tsukamurella sp. M9C TaxID=2877520 RepID=UPI001CCE57A7|nr:Uma2 family endonuclease [Tsukamurella sp. M9C]MCA0155984.1 Uma2 family endonuclease [Tsukamurella sp. M9C]
MTAVQRVELLTLEAWNLLGEDELWRSELQEGVYLRFPNPSLRHQSALMELGVAQLHQQIPAPLRLIPSVDVIVDGSFPPTVRRPDLIVVADHPGDDAITVDHVVLIVEILSPGTRRQDLVTKRSEYADAGIPHYWIVDLDGGPSIEALTLRDGSYEGAVHSGEFTTTVPFELRVDLTALT